VGWYHARWVNIAVLDTLLKRLFTLVLSLVVTVVVLYGISAVMGDGGATETSYGVRKNVLRLGLIFAVWIVIEVVRLIVHTVRAAVTGRYLDEYAQRREERAQQQAERAQDSEGRSSSDKLTAPGTTYLYKGEDPVAKGVPLLTRATNAGLFITQAGRLPDPSAAAGTDEFVHAQALAEVAREVRGPSPSKDANRSAKFLDSCDKSKSWRER